MRVPSRLLPALVVAVSASLGGAAALEAQPPDRKSRWSQARTPSEGPPRAIGMYRAGCLQGGEALPARGPGYQLMGALRPRRFGHPALIDFVSRLGAAAAGEGLEPVRIGDLAQPRGGPMPRLHASHQTGLDVDIYYAPVGPFRIARFPSLVDRRAGALSPHVRTRGAALLRLAAADPRVERIYVNPVIKRALCEEAGPAASAWLGKLQPWWGHHRHFHVQLHCPDDSPECVPRPPVPAGDGCADIHWWFEATSRAERLAHKRAYQALIGARPALPPACRGLLRR